MADLSIPKTEKTNFRRDLGKELALLSYSLWALFIVTVILSVFLYVFMVVPPPKTCVVEDNGKIFSQEEFDKINELARTIAREKDVNVFVYTADIKENFVRSEDSELNAFIDKKYRELADVVFLKDNSGVMIYIDVQERYFYIFTYGTAHASITNSECEEIFQSVKVRLANDDFGGAAIASIKRVQNHNFTSGLLILTYLGMYILPVVLALLIVLWIMKKRKKIPTTNSSTYLDHNNSEVYQNSDTFSRKTVSVTYVSTSSSGGGGFSGGGGGGGGGGRTGGGGGRF